MSMEMKAVDLQGFFPPGESIAERFTLTDKIGKGPFGEVYRADDNLIEAPVAIKIFDSAVIKTPLEEETFLKATRRARALTQKNVVRLHDSGVHKDHPWVSMQQLEGLNLRKVVRLRRDRDEGFSLEELEPIISQITLALQHIGRDYPHGDLKPENIIFLPDLVKVTDSYILSALSESAFADGNANNSFIAPELQSPGGQVDPRCDVYSVGAIIGHMLFGDDYEPGSQSQERGVLAAVDTLCRRAMAFDPAERYPSVEALNEDFTSIVDTGALLQKSSPTPPTAPPAPPSAPGISAPSGPVSPSTAPPAPPPADRPANPLDVETSPDIGMPLEKDLATSEYDREAHRANLGDMLPTNEVDRDSFPKPSEEDLGPPVPKREEIAPPPEKTADKEVQKPTPKKVAPKKASPKKGEKSGPPVGIIVTIVLIALVMGVFVFNQQDSDDPGAVAQAPDAAETETDEPTAAEEVAAAEKAAEEAARAEEERLREERSQMLAQVSTIQNTAVDAASSQARERAEELEAQAAEEAEQPTAQAERTGAGARPAGGSPGAEAAAPQGTNCPSGMVLVRGGGGNVCVDAYQHPGRGRMPEVRVSWFDAQRLCQQQDKRLCALSEWRSACGSRYPYGNSFDPNRCNTADEDGFERTLAAAGASPECRSPSGAYDMSGNVHEWVQEQRVAGGSYNSDGDIASCRYSSPKAAGSSDPDVGFRCCADPQ